ncbi:MAG TPA: hypothetical protein VNF06_02110, partial [Candidatus Aquilonibacter sp.]|nr:hypothetical protein [Candidatus Aquilonibacter sp.]
MAENQTIIKKNPKVELERIDNKTIQVIFPWKVVIDGEVVTQGKVLDKISANQTPEKFAEAVVKLGIDKMHYFD